MKTMELRNERVEDGKTWRCVWGKSPPRSNRLRRFPLPPLRGTPPQRPLYCHTDLFAANAAHGIMEK